MRLTKFILSRYLKSHYILIYTKLLYIKNKGRWTEICLEYEHIINSKINIKLIAFLRNRYVFDSVTIVSQNLELFISPIARTLQLKKIFARDCSDLGIFSRFSSSIGGKEKAAFIDHVKSEKWTVFATDNIDDWICHPVVDELIMIRTERNSDSLLEQYSDK